MTADALILAAGAARCAIRADIGGCLASWTIGDQHLLRPAPVTAGDPRDTASFPLVPYSNRIGHARFDWADGTVQLARNADPEPHALHGVGWQRAWTITDYGNDHGTAHGTDHGTDHGGAHATLSLDHGGDADWPWPFEATQRIVLREDALTLTLRAINRHDAPVPLGFGHHPYFDVARATLDFAASRVFPSDGTSLPLDPVTPQGMFDFGNQAPVAGRIVDNCFSGWNGRARISWDDRPFSVALTASSTLSALVVYIPAGGDFFCVEPVPNINNALNRPGDMPGLPVIAPGDAFTADLEFRAVPAR